MCASTSPPATIVAAALPLIADALRAAGIDAARAFRDTGLALQPSAHAGAAIPLDAFARLLQQAGQQNDDVTRLWRCGAKIAEPALDCLFPTGLRERRLGLLIDRVLEDLAHLQEGTVFRRTVAGDTCILTYRINDPSIWPRSRDAEFTLGFLDAVLRRFAGDALHLFALGFEHERDGPSGLEQATGLAALYGEPANTLAFPAALLDLPVMAGDGRNGAWRDRPPRPCTAPPDPERRILDAIYRRLGQGGVAQADIAGDCGLSVRSLRRQLDASGQSFRSLLERARLAYALWALTETGLPIGEIAHRLGYDGQSAFARAFKRRTGAPPSRYRCGQTKGDGPSARLPGPEPGSRSQKTRVVNGPDPTSCGSPIPDRRLRRLREDAERGAMSGAEQPLPQGQASSRF